MHSSNWPRRLRLGAFLKSSRAWGILLLLIWCGACFGQSDSVTIVGQFVNPAGTFPKEITLLSASDPKFQMDVPVGVYGEFKCSFKRRYLSFYILQTGMYSNAFPVGE